MNLKFSVCFLTTQVPSLFRCSQSKSCVNVKLNHLKQTWIKHLHSPNVYVKIRLPCLISDAVSLFCISFQFIVPRFSFWASCSYKRSLDNTCMDHFCHTAKCSSIDKREGIPPETGKVSARLLVILIRHHPLVTLWIKMIEWLKKNLYIYINILRLRHCPVSQNLKFHTIFVVSGCVNWRWKPIPFLHVTGWTLNQRWLAIVSV